ncbi:hypothetical protein [Streptomyces sp. NPDC004546]|uniref:hypothetical protein n=1 Tax=Streptomyces sp. NPDC004546 TaxID=3154282 RepID=UPI0033B737A1
MTSAPCTTSELQAVARHWVHWSLLTLGNAANVVVALHDPAGRLGGALAIAGTLSADDTSWKPWTEWVAGSRTH